jgi:hypothetical protein
LYNKASAHAFRKNGDLCYGWSRFAISSTYEA